MKITKPNLRRNKSFRVTLLGTGAAWPDAQRNAPGFLVESGADKMLIDCGGGTSHQLMRRNVHPALIDHGFLTHLHIDHVVEMPSLIFGSYLTQKQGPYHIYGPTGTKRHMGLLFDALFEYARPLLRQLRNKEIEIETTEVDNGDVISINSLQVRAAAVEHGIPAVAYRFEANNHAVVFSGDTEPCENLVNLANNADLLVVECSFPENTGPKKGHLIPSQVGKIAQSANVKQVILTHLFPVCDGKEKEILSVIRQYYRGPVKIGKDAMSVEI
jgi:ribonuclease BN (tRNA processing enzyme)